jgi:hypothetical protein
VHPFKLPVLYTGKSLPVLFTGVVITLSAAALAQHCRENHVFDPTPAPFPNIGFK